MTRISHQTTLNNSQFTLTNIAIIDETLPHIAKWNNFKKSKKKIRKQAIFTEFFDQN
jgi:hypothetical protein